ncbi:MAG: GatB/YqeY domain-containing protein, partial [bacterium]
MKAKLKEALKPAMKAKDRVRLDTIRGILSEIQYEEMQRSVTDLTESDCTLILHRELKKRQESLQFAEQANREDSKTTLLLEISIIESFLPVQLNAQELERIILEVKSSTP